MKIAWIIHIENRSVTASREAPVFDVYPDPVESFQDSLDFITNALAKFNSSLVEAIPLQNYSTTFGKSQVFMIFRFNTVLPSQPRGKLVPEKQF